MAVDWVMRASSGAPAPKEDPMSSLKLRDFSAGGSSLFRDQNGIVCFVAWFIIRDNRARVSAAVSWLSWLLVLTIFHVRWQSFFTLES